MSTASPMITKARLEKWRSNLLDMTRRNRLLYFKESTTSTFTMPYTPGSLFDLLVGEDAVVGFPKLETPEEEDARFTFLNKMRLKTQTTLKEQGVQTLYVALGFLKWKETVGSEETIVSPLLLVPVELVRERGLREFTLRRSSGDELVANPTLARKLESDFRLTLPEFTTDDGSDEAEGEEGSNYAGYIARVNQAIAKNEGWSIDERACMAIFNFAKLAMFKDMEQFEDAMSDHKLVRALSGDKDARLGEPADSVTAKRIDTVVHPQDLLMVVDADSSQQEAILLARQGHSFVLQGPPGTGKSQTITNIVAELIGQGRSVLFVSEKMAALDVVRKRLFDCGLGDFCLEMHSNKVQKKQVIAELHRTLQLALDGPGRSAQSFQFEELKIVRDRLNRYVNELHIVRPQLNKSAFQVYAELAKLDGTPELSFAFPDILSVSEPQLREIERLLDELQTYAHELAMGSEHPWMGALPTTFTHALASDIRIHFKAAADLSRGYAGAGAALAAALGLPAPVGREASLPMLAVARHLLATPGPLAHWLIPGAPERLIALVGEAQERLQAHERQRQTLLAKATPSVLDLDHDAELAALDNEILRGLVGLLRRGALQSQDAHDGPDVADQLVAQKAAIKAALDLIERGHAVLVQHAELAGRSGVKHPENIGDWNFLTRLAKLMSQSPAPRALWFAESALPRVRQLVSEGAALCGSFLSHRSELLRHYNETVLGFDVTAIEPTLDAHAPVLARFKAGSEPMALVDSQRVRLGSLIDGILAVVTAINGATQQAAVLTGLGLPKNQTELRAMIALLDATLGSPCPLSAWLAAEDADRMVRQLSKHIKASDELRAQRESMSKLYHDEVFEIDVDALYQRFMHDYVGFTRLLKPAYYKDLEYLKRLSTSTRKVTADDARRELRALKDYKKAEASLRDEEKRLSTQLDRFYEGTDTDWPQVARVVTWASEFASQFPDGVVPAPLAALISGPASGLAPLREVVTTLRDGSERLNALLVEWATLCDFSGTTRPEGLSFDALASSVLATQEAVQECCAVIDALRVHQHGGNRHLSHLRDDLRKIKAVQEARAYIDAKGGQLSAELGGFYDGLDTDWSKLSSVLEWCEALEGMFGGAVPQAVVMRAEQANDGQLGRDAAVIEQALAQLVAGHQGLFELFNLAADGVTEDAATVEPDTFARWASRAQRACSELWTAHARVAGCLLDGGGTTAARITIRYLLDVLQETKAFLMADASVRSAAEGWRAEFGERFQGLGTDWLELSGALGWSGALLNLAGQELTSQVSALASSRHRAHEDLAGVISQLDQIDGALAPEWRFVETILSADALQHAGEALAARDLGAAAQWLDAKVEGLVMLERYLLCKDVMRRCDGLGLDQFVSALVAKPGLIVADGLYRNVFLRRFYQQWLDGIAAHAPTLAAFQGRDHERLIQEFAKLDEKSIDANRARIQAKLRSGLGPSVQLALPHEVDIIRRQAAAKRQWPLRKLIGATRSLLTKIKPCWLMSPLSVSQFLETTAKMFDVVVFDEASQMPTEDAIGAIYRGSQLIVVGDRHQLPPSRFFATSESADDDDEEIEIFESVLDEAMSCMPSRMLLWHYRSRHESLIAFSNKHFYDNRLFTFPNAHFGQGAGVSFVHVEDGVYESSTNRIEARRVAELVFEHFDLYPKQSLGVIAFSEAQQMVIVDEIERLRKVRPLYEPFFDEGKQDAFFVKNLENVQGDERDAIIFSVCYAKDPAGKMAYRFGPLTRAGGERRLNVAVTRARCQIKLVSSIRASDMDPASCRSKGAQLLRSYIDYAERGVRAILEAVTVDETRFDSPFEEEVYSALTARGLQLHTQVGCSGYRIDLAVQDPKTPGRYLLGIECDGAAYHSAATARDRDRLRQQVLERLDWKIHRIWSRDWINNRQLEVQKILAALGG